MTRVRLELNKIQIHRPKETWRLYFVVVADHPDDQDAMVVSMVPENAILVVPEQKNIVSFEPEGTGTEGLLLLSRELPSNRELNVHLHILHSRRPKRELGKLLIHFESEIGKKGTGIVSNILGTNSPWLAISRSGLPLVGQILSKISDRNMGFVSMFERFGPEFESEVEIDRENRGGHCTVVHSWSIDQ